MDFNFCIPYVGGIIEREKNERIELLIQTRWKPERDELYSGTLEFPAGCLDRVYENVYDTLEREIKEETGLQLKSVKNDSRTKVFKPQSTDEAFGFRPFCCTQQLKEGYPWIGFIFICEVEDGEFVPQKDEVKDIVWMDKEEARELYYNSPEKFFTLEIPALEYYFQDN
ncbi:NUDIX domain-containing protein [Candidatus Dojkabacteria bacterium]|nr:NUDIX domain-containing protein [Candidatus Dojkabacteria bacterium]